MGVLLIATIILVFSTIIYRLVKRDTAHVAPPYLVDSHLPAGAVLERMTLHNDVLAVEIKTSDGAFILLYDVKQGHERGRIHLMKK